MKKLWLSVCAVALGMTLVSAEDAYVRSFVESTKNERVVYDGSKLILYASPSALKTALFGLVSGVMLAGGAAGIAIAVDDVAARMGDRVALGIFAAACLAVGGYTGYRFVDMLHKHLNKIPYFTFDNTGLWQYEVLKFRWSEMHSVEFRSKVVGDRNYVDTFREVFFMDKYKKEFLTLMENDIFLPISIDTLVALVEHHQKQYGNQQA